MFFSGRVLPVTFSILSKQLMYMLLVIMNIFLHWVHSYTVVNVATCVTEILTLKTYENMSQHLLSSMFNSLLYFAFFTSV